MAKQPVTIAITYCAECGYEDPTLRLVRRLMDEFHMYLRRIEITPAVNGELEVVVDGELIHSTMASGLFPKPDEIVAAVRQRLEA
jgi:selT/selW/selH-like putative selenoprotein